MGPPAFARAPLTAVGPTSGDKSIGPAPRVACCWLASLFALASSGPCGLPPANWGLSPGGPLQGQSGLRRWIYLPRRLSIVKQPPRPEERGRRIVLLDGRSALIARAIGPACVGGVLTEQLFSLGGWFFFVNIPVAVSGIVVLGLLVVRVKIARRTAPGTDRFDPARASSWSPNPPLSEAGAVPGVSGAGCFPAVQLGSPYRLAAGGSAAWRRPSLRARLSAPGRKRTGRPRPLLQFERFEHARELSRASVVAFCQHNGFRGSAHPQFRPTPTSQTHPGTTPRRPPGLSGAVDPRSLALGGR